jgi:hypothetical protein
MEPLGVEEKVVFQLLPGIDASWWSLEYQFAVVSSREMMSDFARVASSLQLRLW